MKKILKIFTLIFAVALVAGMLSIPTFATGTATEIYNYEDFLKIADNPDGEYKLMADVDFSGHEWTPIDFSGSLDGNNKALLNITIKSPSTISCTTYDGDLNKYDSYLAGLFARAEGATISNLKILGMNIKITTEDNCFIGSIAGKISDNTVIKNCSVDSSLSLYASSKTFGVGGIAGFAAAGEITDCTITSTIVVTDKSAATEDEEFSGGVYALGYADCTNNKVNLTAYVSDHNSSAHNGGLIGMYVLCPSGTTFDGHVNANETNGSIKFFIEGNSQLYVKPYVNDIIDWTFEYEDNTDDFQIEQVFEYTDLEPHTCTDASYYSLITPSTDTVYGYTTYTCKDCNYSYKADYTALLGNPERVTEPATEEETTTAEPETEKKGTSAIVVIIIIIAILAALFFGYVFISSYIQEKKRQRRREERRRQRMLEEQRRHLEEQRRRRY